MEGSIVGSLEFCTNILGTRLTPGPVKGRGLGLGFRVYRVDRVDRVDRVYRFIGFIGFIGLWGL